MIFDTHAHYDDEQFNEDRVEFMQKGYRTCKGVSICICGSRDSSG